MTIVATQPSSKYIISKLPPFCVNLYLKIFSQLSAAWTLMDFCCLWLLRTGGRLGIGLGGRHTQQHGEQVQHAHFFRPLGHRHAHQRGLPPARAGRDAFGESQEKCQTAQQEHGGAGDPGHPQRQHRWDDRVRLRSMRHMTATSRCHLSVFSLKGWAAATSGPSSRKSSTPHPSWTCAWTPACMEEATGTSHHGFALESVLAKHFMYQVWISHWPNVFFLAPRRASWTRPLASTPTLSTMRSRTPSRTSSEMWTQAPSCSVRLPELFFSF